MLNMHEIPDFALYVAIRGAPKLGQRFLLPTNEAPVHVLSQVCQRNSRGCTDATRCRATTSFSNAHIRQLALDFGASRRFLFQSLCMHAVDNRQSKIDDLSAGIEATHRPHSTAAPVIPTAILFIVLYTNHLSNRNKQVDTYEATWKPLPFLLLLLGNLHYPPFLSFFI